MSPRKLGTKRGHSGQKSRPDLMVRSHLIMSMIGYGYSALEIRNELGKKWNVSKQLIAEDFKRMIANGWIIDLHPDVNKYKYYGLTESGRTVLSGYEKSESSRLVKLENVRHKCSIQNTVYLKRFLSVEKYGFESNRKFKNVMMYHGKINGLTVQVAMGKIPSMIITPRPMFVSSVRRNRPKIQQTVLDLVNDLNRDWLFNLTPPIAISGHGQVAIGGKLPRDILEANGGGSIRIKKPYGTISIDASPPHKMPQIEYPYDMPEKLDDLLDLPDTTRTMKLEIADITSNVSFILESISEIKTKSDDDKKEIIGSMSMMSNAMIAITSAMESQSESTKNVLMELVKKITDLTNTLSGATQQKQEASPPNPVLSSDASKMFG